MLKVGKHLFEFGPFRLDPGKRLLFRDSQPVPVQPKTFDILLALVQSSGQLVLKEDLMKTVWQDTFVEESNLTQNVFVLRKILGETAGEHRYIATIPGRGYRFVGEVRTVHSETGRDDGLTKTNSQPSVAADQEVRLATKTLFGSRLRRAIIAVAVPVVMTLVAVAILEYPAPQPLKVLSVRQITHTGRVAPFSRVVTDGTRLYFAERIGGIDALAESPVDGGEPAFITTTIPSVQVYDIDPAKSRLLIGTQGTDFNNPVWVVSTSGGAARRLSDVLASEGSGWSRDGHGIFYGHDTQIYKITDNGEDPHRLLTAEGYVISVRMSPDNTRLRFTARDRVSGGNSVWESTVDGRNSHQLSFGWKPVAPQWGEGECYGDWSPDGRFFVFRSAHDGVDSIWGIREDTGWLRKNAAIPVQLYATPDHVGEPRFSPDGQKIFFVHYEDRRELVRFDSTQKLFVPYLGGIPARILNFSPDGKWVAYRSDIDGSLWRSRVDGSEKIQLTFPPMAVYHSSWSADGKSVVFGGSVPGSGSHLYSVPIEGGTPQILTQGDGADTHPSCSPDGHFIFFERRIINGPDNQQYALYSLDLKTHTTQMVPGSAGFESVHVSPDGKYAAAADTMNHRLMLFDLARQQWTKLSDGTPYGWGMRWSSDSRYIYFQRPEESEAQPIYRLRISDRKVEQITSANQILRADVLGYTMTGLTPDNAPLATLNHRNSDVYALDLDLPRH